MDVLLIGYELHLNCQLTRVSRPWTKADRPVLLLAPIPLYPAQLRSRALRIFNAYRVWASGAFLLLADISFTCIWTIGSESLLYSKCNKLWTLKLSARLWKCWHIIWHACTSVLPSSLVIYEYMHAQDHLLTQCNSIRHSTLNMVSIAHQLVNRLHRVKVEQPINVSILW